MSNSLLMLAREFPDLQVSIRLGDLIEANKQLIAQIKREMEQTIAIQNAETYLSRSKVMEMLEISSSTLWRWMKTGYLVPLNVGGKTRYRMSDVKRIIEGDNTQGDIHADVPQRSGGVSSNRCERINFSLTKHYV